MYAASAGRAEAANDQGWSVYLEKTRCLKRWFTGLHEAVFL